MSGPPSFYQPFQTFINIMHTLCTGEHAHVHIIMYHNLVVQREAIYNFCLSVLVADVYLSKLNALLCMKCEQCSVKGRHHFMYYSLYFNLLEVMVTVALVLLVGLCSCMLAFHDLHIWLPNLLARYNS